MTHQSKWNKSWTKCTSFLWFMRYPIMEALQYLMNITWVQFHFNFTFNLECPKWYAQYSLEVLEKCKNSTWWEWRERKCKKGGWNLGSKLIISRGSYRYKARKSSKWSKLYPRIKALINKNHRLKCSFTRDYPNMSALVYTKWGPWIWKEESLKREGK